MLSNSTDHVVVVTNTTLNDLYPDLVSQVLQNSGVRVSTCVLADGEEYKNLETLSLIFDFLIKFSANRKTLLVAFGGGVIGDMSGFAAATFLVLTVTLYWGDGSMLVRESITRNLVELMCRPMRQKEIRAGGRQSNVFVCDLALCGLDFLFPHKFRFGKLKIQN